jgi:uncharacterized protein (TIGR02145 family)
MNKQFIEVLVYLFIISISLVNCKKDDSNPTNPTNGKTTSVFNTNITYGTMTDKDGNVYKTVTIGKQTWMAENLRTTKYNDGTAIPNVTENTAWSGLSTGAYCNYLNTFDNDYEFIATYGRFYNWYAVNSGKLAPTGWHVPTDAEWTTLSTYLGDYAGSGSKLKEVGSLHFLPTNSDATNETGFTGLPGGLRDWDGYFSLIHYEGNYWSSKESVSYYAYIRSFGYSYNWFQRTEKDKRSGISVRCIKN